MQPLYQRHNLIYTEGHLAPCELGMDALVILCSCNANGIMVWAWMLWSSYALGTRTELWFGHGCCGERMLLNTNGIMVWAWMLWSSYALGRRTELWIGHGCCGERMLLELRTELWFWHACFVNRTHSKMNGIMVWSWMLC